MIDPITEYILHEGYVLSDKTISINLSDFQSGKRKKLLIIGTAGSGKTTLGEILAKKMRVKWVSIDSLWWRLKQQYFKDVDEKKEELEAKVFEKTIEHLRSSERLIIEGVDLIELYGKKPEYKKLILNQAMIILGVSALRAGLRAGVRNKNREGGEGWRELYWMTQINMKTIEPRLKMIRQAAVNMPDAEIKKFNN